MDKRDKPSVSFNAADGMSGKMDKGKTPAPRGGNAMVDCSGDYIMKKVRGSYSTTPTSNMGKGGPMRSATVGGRTRAAQVQKGGK